MDDLPAALYQQLLDEARAVAARAWCPHSMFPVGAALLTRDGRILPGCNVENASFGLTNCAERSALFAAVSQGVGRESLRALLVYAPGVPVISPCGACRQVMLELMPPECPVYCVGHDPSASRAWTVAELLPGAFVFPE
ncbi:cytidine deaminase [Stutzerimonas stutzeri]|uniref:cytidine deaminase n=1 Tax=Stutzerimonas stutzeri TaxID=316 RepID=UPI000F766802|nr:cytidine deaminase [Stutzerimonas stutzeri]MDI9738391.1 cytidine deaminase [Stutzerimonas stutzeri]RRW17032.1 cytidine deaminase [Stutzerimonas stutzeri]RSH67154.1 cytidine deaminase [Stutzerimonas stutzeri]